MENNNPIIPAAPTPSTSSMPEFAAAPAAPAPVIPPATAMPEFGQPQPAAPQPAPVAPVQEPAETTPTEAAPAEPTVEPNAADEAIVSTLGEISNEPIQTPEAQPADTPAPADESAPVDAPNPAAPTDPTAAIESATTEVPSAVESTVSPTTQSLEQTPVNKKPNMKIIAICAAAAVLLVGAIVAVLLISNNSPKPQDPAEAPVSTYDAEPDNSTAFEKLDKETALAYLTAVGKTEKYFPTNLLNDDDRDVIAFDEEKGTVLLLSYEDVEKAKESVLTVDFLASIEGGKATKSSFEFSAKDDYVVVTPADSESECISACRGVAFDKTVFNYFMFTPSSDDPTVATPAVLVPAFVFVKHDEETLKRYLPVVSYIFSNGIVYSADFASTDTAYTYTVHSLAVGVDQIALATAGAGEVPYAITSTSQTFSVDKTTGAFSFTEALPDAINISITTEEATPLI